MDPDLLANGEPVERVMLLAEQYVFDRIRFTRHSAVHALFEKVQNKSPLRTLPFCRAGDPFAIRRGQSRRQGIRGPTFMALI